jgi:hypothetical protein
MKSLIPSLLSMILVASCASTIEPGASESSGRVVELQPFTSRHVDSGRAKGFRIQDAVVKEVPTRIEIYDRKSTPVGFPGTPGRRVLETRTALVVSVHYDDGIEREDDAPYDEIDLVIPAGELDPELIAQVRDLSTETWWRPLDNLRRLNARRELIREHLSLDVREYSRDAKVIDFNRSFVCPRDHLSCPPEHDEIVRREVTQSFKEVSLLTHPAGELTSEPHED